MILKCIGSIMFGLIKVFVVCFYCMFTIPIRFLTALLGVSGNDLLAEKIEDKLLGIFDWLQEWELPFLKIHP